MFMAQLADVMAPGKVLTPAKKESGAHVPRKSKGIGGEATVLSAAVLKMHHGIGGEASVP
jgi:hypothetical protein